MIDLYILDEAEFVYAPDASFEEGGLFLEVYCSNDQFVETPTIEEQQWLQTVER